MIAYWIDRTMNLLVNHWNCDFYCITKNCDSWILMKNMKKDTDLVLVYFSRVLETYIAFVWSSTVLSFDEFLKCNGFWFQWRTVRSRCPSHWMSRSVSKLCGKSWISLSTPVGPSTTAGNSWSSIWPDSRTVSLALQGGGLKSWKIRKN